MNYFFQVVAFADTPSEGNPAAVFVLDKEPAEDWMIKMAAEFSQPIHSFVWKKSGSSSFTTRFRTPDKQVPLSGHGALSAAHGLWQAGQVAKNQPVELDTLAGPVSLSLADDKIEIEMETIPFVPSDDAANWRIKLGLPEKAEIYFIDRQKLGFSILVVLSTFEDIKTFKPDLDFIRETMPFGLIITAPSERKTEDFASRFFIPSYGIDEEFVTGIIHATLFPFWSARLRVNKLIGFQASERGGFLYGTTHASGGTLSLKGKVLTISRGELV